MPRVRMPSQLSIPRRDSELGDRCGLSRFTRRMKYLARKASQPSIIEKRKNGKMKKTGMYLFVLILIGASLLAACGQAPAQNANSSAPAGAPLAPAATAIPQSTNANSSPLMQETVSGFQGRGRHGSGGSCCRSQGSSKRRLSLCVPNPEFDSRGDLHS